MIRRSSPYRSSTRIPVTASCPLNPCVGVGRKKGDMTELAPSLVELARRYGIATGYQDWTGQDVLVPETTLVAVLAALGVVAATEEQRNAALTAQLRWYWTR